MRKFPFNSREHNITIIMQLKYCNRLSLINLYDINERAINNHFTGTSDIDFSQYIIILPLYNCMHLFVSQRISTFKFNAIFPF